MAEIAELLKSHFEESVATDIEGLINEYKDLRSHFARDWFYEVELRTHFVVPLLRLLGWSPTHMKMEWNNADIVLLSAPFKTLRTQSETNSLNNPFVHTIIELKAPHHCQMDAAQKQCRKYTVEFSKVTSHVSTNGQLWIFDFGLGPIGVDTFNMTAEDAHNFSLLSRNSLAKSNAA